MAVSLTAAALTPAAGQLLTAHAQEGGEVSPWQRRRAVLKRMPSDATVLINVSYAEMPSSPDILNLGKKATKALERCLADNANASIRRDCAMMLQALGDRRALASLRDALGDWDAGVRAQAVEALGAMPDKASFEPLSKLYKRRDESHYNKLRILRSLGQLGDKRAVQLLRAEARRKPKDKDPEHRVAALRALWMSRHLMARGTLVGDISTALRSDHDGLTLEAVHAAAELRARQHVRALVPLMEHKNTEVRNKAVYALGKIGDRTASRALLAHVPKVREARMLNNIAFALERLDPKAFYPAVEKLIRHKQAIIRLNASYVVGDVKRPEGLSLLQEALKDQSDFVRTSAVVAMGKLGTDKAVTPLRPFANDSNLVIRQEAIYAINELTKGKDKDLIYEQLFASKLAKKPQHQWMRRRAAVKLGELGDPRVRTFLLECFESRRCGYWEVEEFLEQDKHKSTPGRLLLNWVRGRSELTGIVGDFKPSGSLDMASNAFDHALAQKSYWGARHSADLLGDLGQARAVKTLEPQLKNQDSWLRAHVAVALARLGQGAAPETLLADLDNLPAEWLPRYVHVLSRVSEQKVQKKLHDGLEKRARGKDADVALASAAVLLSWDPEKGVFRLLDALSDESVRKRELADAYLRRNGSKKLTWVLRRALARETRPFTRDRLRTLLDERG